MRLPYCRSGAIALCCLCLSACTMHNWRPVSGSPRAYIEEESPQVIRVTEADGAQRIVRNARIRGDSIVSATGPDVVPLDDVQRVDAQEVSVTQSVAASVLLVAGLVAVPVVLCLASAHCIEGPLDHVGQ